MTPPDRAYSARPARKNADDEKPASPPEGMMRKGLVPDSPAILSGSTRTEGSRYAARRPVHSGYNPLRSTAASGPPKISSSSVWPVIPFLGRVLRDKTGWDFYRAGGEGTPSHGPQRTSPG